MAFFKLCTQTQHSAAYTNIAFGLTCMTLCLGRPSIAKINRANSKPNGNNQLPSYPSGRDFEHVRCQKQRNTLWVCGWVCVHQYIIGIPVCLVSTIIFHFHSKSNAHSATVTWSLVYRMCCLWVFSYKLIELLSIFHTHTHAHTKLICLSWLFICQNVRFSFFHNLAHFRRFGCECNT